MKKGLKRFATISLAMLMALSIVPNSTISVNASGLNCYAANVLQIVPQDADVSNFSVLESLKMSGAKGETEGAQFFVHADNDWNGYDLTVSELKCGQSVIGMENIDLYVQIYTEASDSVLFVGTYGGGIYPDCLIPISYIKQAGENKVVAGKNQGFWVDVSIPETAESGIYTGTVTFTVNGQKKEIPLSVEVYDFAMPQAPGLATCYLIWDDWLLDAEFDNTTNKHWDYYNTLLDYNISGYVFPSETTEDFVAAMVEYYDKVNMFGVPYRAISKTENDWDYYISYMLAIGEQCKKDGVNYFEKAYYYFDMFYDEATSFDWRIEQMKSIIQTTDECEEYIINRLVESGTVIDSATCEIAESIRGLQHAITTEEYMHDTWEGILDMYVQHSKGFTTTADVQLYNNLLEDPEYTIWGYTTELCDYPNPAVNISGVPVTARDVYWFDYEVGVTGELYWCVNCNVNCTSVSGLRYAPIYNPYTNACHDSVSNGGGYYLYPGMHYGSDKPFPSIRLAVKRDGIDDYTYMTELEKRYTEKDKQGSVRQIVSFMNELLIKSGRSMINEEGLFASRENLAKLIEAYDTYGLVIEDIAYTDGGIKIVASANDGVQVTINGSEITCKTNAKEMTIRLESKKTFEQATGFENAGEEDVVSVQTQYGSSVRQSVNVTHGGDKSAQVMLSGYTEFADSNNLLTYKPAFTISLESLGLRNGFSDCIGLSFYVYNAGAERVYEVYVQSKNGSATSTVVYDKVILKSNAWTKIEIDNLKMISLNETEYKNVVRVGLRTDNMYANNTAYTQTLYVDDICVGRK